MNNSKVMVLEDWQEEKEGFVDLRILRMGHREMS
jgi:hypothetical protein